jgi:hypothetical protein
MKIKLRPDGPGSSGPTEWSEMNDWLADLRKETESESETSFGSTDAGQPPWDPAADPAEARDEVQPPSAAAPAADGPRGHQPYATAEPEAYGTAQPQPYPGAEPEGYGSALPQRYATGEVSAYIAPQPRSYGPAEHPVYGAPVPQSYGAPVPESYGAAQSQPFAVPVPEPDDEPQAPAHGGWGPQADSQLRSVEPWTAEPATIIGPQTYREAANASGAHKIHGTGEAYGAPVVSADDQLYGDAVADAATDPDLGTYEAAGSYDLGDVTEVAEPHRAPEGSGPFGVLAATGVATVAAEQSAGPDVTSGTYPAMDAEARGANAAEVGPGPYGAPSDMAADLLDTPGASATSGTAGASEAAGASGNSVAGRAAAASATAVASETAAAGATAVANGTAAASGTAATSAAAPAVGTPGRPALRLVTTAPPAPVTPPPPAEPEPVVRALIGDELRTPTVWCELDAGHCISWHADREALGVADVRARAIAAGWRIDAMGRLTCPQCQQHSTLFRATHQVVLWNRAYALTMAARQAERQGRYSYPQPAFYPR